MRAIIATTVNGPMIIPPYDTYVGAALVTMGAYCPPEFATWRPYLKPGDVVVDAGANLGAHTLSFAGAVGMQGSVFAFEPQRRLAQMLCGSVELCGAQNVRVIQAALTREAGTMRIPDLNYGVPFNFGGLSLRDVTADMPHEDVDAYPLDALNMPRLDFLKIDVEGMELDVLHGAKQTIDRCRPVICAEADREKNIPALMGWFRLNGYRLWWHRPPLGPYWPRIVSQNLMALPRELEGLPEPQGDIEAIDT